MTITPTTSSSTAHNALGESRKSILAFAKHFESSQTRTLASSAAITSFDAGRAREGQTDSSAPALPEGDIFSRIANLLGEDVTPLDPPRPITNVIVTGRWEGFVTAVEDETFDGEFVPVDKTEPRMQATFLISEVDPDDTELIHRGALFYIVSSEVRVSARRWQPSSVVQFRRIPRVTDDDVVGALAQAAKLRQKLGLAE